MRAKDGRGPYFKSLEDQQRQRHYFTAVDSENGRKYYWEAVEDRGALVAIKQLEVDRAGHRWRYNWQHLEDEHGFLTEAKLEADRNVTFTSEIVFRAEWEAGD